MFRFFSFLILSTTLVWVFELGVAYAVVFDEVASGVVIVMGLIMPSFIAGFVASFLGIWKEGRPAYYGILAFLYCIVLPFVGAVSSFFSACWLLVDCRLLG
jgi:hypothetical protein